ncbi:sigma-70 family RNA polymerase sigma factor [Cohnella massiliensis]|uniref:sigma-70 family RNA polymerase sigma factor n=1 Tax=Cohnella massiliensis TaxID=1816691 RepID=UPI0009BC41CB|nr:sigma-70 family RNA polymerase sigma factor [Cohnella massiliensis]
MSARKWYSEALIEAIKARYTGNPTITNQLMAEFQVPRYVITNYAKKCGVARKKEPNWTEKETQFLIQHWSEKGLVYCAKRLKRTTVAVKLKAKRLGLGGIVKNSQFLTGQNVANLMGIDIHSVLRWLDKGYLKYKSAPFPSRSDRNRTTTMISLEDLEVFLKSYPNLWDSRKMVGSLWLQDPDWLVAKKAADRARPPAEGRKWTRDEDKRLIALFKLGTMTYQQIGEILGRSSEAVQRRLSRLDVWGTGKFVGARYERKKREL